MFSSITTSFYKSFVFLIIVLNVILYVKCDPLLLTPYIEKGLLSEAKNLSLVKDLPNVKNIESYSGFLTINKEFNSNLFFWFFPSFVSI